MAAFYLNSISDRIWSVGIGWFGSVWFRTGRHRIEFEFEFDRECRGLHAHRAIQSVIYVFI